MVVVQTHGPDTICEDQEGNQLRRHSSFFKRVVQPEPGHADEREEGTRLAAPNVDTRDQGGPPENSDGVTQDDGQPANPDAIARDQPEVRGSTPTRETVPKWRPRRTAGLPSRFSDFDMG